MEKEHEKKLELDIKEKQFNERCELLKQQRFGNTKDELTQTMKPELVAYSFEEQTMEIVYPVQSWQRNPRGELHGGILAFFFDSTLGIHAYCASERWQSTTTDLAVNYIRPIMSPNQVRVRSKIVRVGRNLIRVSGEAYMEADGKLAATAYGTFMVLPGVEQYRAGQER